jgi:hypothetical protein
MIRMHELDLYSKHSGDFDGDHVTLLLPTEDTQKFYKTDVLELINKPYTIFNQILRNVPMVTNATTKFQIVSDLEGMLKDRAEQDFEALYLGDKHGDKETYQRLLDEKVDRVKAKVLNDDPLKEIFKEHFKVKDINDQFFSENKKDIQDLIKLTWLSERNASPEKGADAKEYVVTNRLLIDNKGKLKNVRLNNKQILNELEHSAFMGMFKPLIATRDQLSGFQQKQLLMSNLGKGVRKEITADDINYTAFKVDEHMIMAIDNDIAKRADSVAVYKALLKEGGMEENIIDQYITEGFNAGHVVVAIQHQEYLIRQTPKFMDAFKTAVETQSGSNDIRETMKETLDEYEKLTNGTLKDLWLPSSRNKGEYQKIANAVVRSGLEKVRSEDSKRTRFLDSDSLTSEHIFKDKYILIDTEGAFGTTAEDAFILNKSFAEDKNNKIVHTFALRKRPKALRDPSIEKFYMDTDKENGIDIYVAERRLQDNVKFLSLHNAAFGKGVVDRVENIELVGNPIKNEDIALVASSKHLDRLMKDISTKNYEYENIKVMVDGQERKMIAIKTDLGIAENADNINQFGKEKPIDILTFNFNQATAESPALFGDFFFTVEDGKVVFDNQTLARAMKIRNDSVAPGINHANVVSTHYKIMISSVIMLAPRTEAREQAASTYLQPGTLFGEGSVEQAFGLMYKLHGSPEDFFNKIKDKPMLRRVFSAELNERMENPIYTSFSADKLESEYKQKGFLAYPESRSKHIEKTVSTLDGKTTDAMYGGKGMYEDSDGNVSRVSRYMSVKDYVNFLLNGEAHVSTNDIIFGTANKSLGLVNLRNNKYQSQFAPLNVDDLDSTSTSEYNVNKNLKQGSSLVNVGSTQTRQGNILPFLDTTKKSKKANYLQNDIYEYAQDRRSNQSFTKEQGALKPSRKRSNRIQFFLDSLAKDVDDPLTRINLMSTKTPVGYTSRVNPRQIVQKGTGLSFEHTTPKVDQDPTGVIRANDLGELNKKLTEAFKNKLWFDVQDKPEDSYVRNNILESIDKKRHKDEVQNKAFREFYQKDIKEAIRFETEESKMFIHNNPDEDYYDDAIKFHKRYESGDTKRTIEKSFLANDGLYAKDAYGAGVSEGLSRYHRSWRSYKNNLLNGLQTLTLRVRDGGVGTIKGFDRYVMITTSMAYLNSKNIAPDAVENVMSRLKNHGINNIDKAKEIMKDFENSNPEIVQLFNYINSNIKTTARSVAIRANKEMPDDFNLLFVNSSRYDQDANKKAFSWTINTMFKNQKVSTDEFLVNLQNNWADSIDVISSNIAKLQATMDMREHFSRVGALDNKKIYNSIERVIEGRLDSIQETNEPKDKMFRTTLLSHLTTKYRGSFNPVRLHSEIEDGKFYKSTYNAFKAQRAEYKQDILDDLGVTYKDAAELNKLRLEHPNNEIFEQALDLEYAFDTFKSDLVAQFPNLRDAIISEAKRIAIENDAAFVDEFGRKIPGTKGSGPAFRPLYEMDLDYIHKTVKFLESGDSFEERLAAAIVQGKVYLMNEGLSDHLHNKFFTIKEAPAVTNAVRQIGRTATKLIMSSPFRLVTRIVQFSFTDVALTSLTDPLVLFKEGPRAFKHVSAFFQSKGSAITRPELADLKEFVEEMGFNPEKDLGLDLVTFDHEVNMPKIGKGYFDFVDKALSYQMFAGRYMLWRSVKASFDDPTKTNIYGPTYTRREAIDALTTNSAKAMAVVDATLGSAGGGFPIIARDKLKDFAIFTTYSLALLRAGVENAKSIRRAVAEIASGHVDETNVKQLLRTTGSLAATYLITQLVISAVAGLFGVDEDTEEEWKKENVFIDPVQTALQARPVTIYGGSFFIPQQWHNMLTRPFTDNEHPVDMFMSFANTNLLSKLNPAYKIPAEVILNKDFFGQLPQDSKADNWMDNLARKIASFPLGVNGANAAMDAWNYSGVDENNPEFFERLGRSAMAALTAEMGNTRGYKADQKNYFKAMRMLYSYRVIEQKANPRSFENSGFQRDLAFPLSRKMKNALDSKQPPSVIYGLINEAILDGATESEIRYALRNNSISGRLQQLENPQEFYESLSEKEERIMEDAVRFERQNYSILYEMLQEFESIRTNNTRQYVPRSYFNIPRTSGNYYNRVNNRFNSRDYREDPTSKYRPKNTFIPSLTGFTGRNADTNPKGITGLTPEQIRSLDGLDINRIAKGKPKKHVDHKTVWRENK